VVQNSVSDCPCTFRRVRLDYLGEPIAIGITLKKLRFD
jgi:hypothetical protein